MGHYMNQHHAIPGETQISFEAHARLAHTHASDLHLELPVSVFDALVLVHLSTY